ncbi:hypothetical protein BAJUN_02310 [Bajunvirus bajun]|uniref:Uncharacterized protein n=1 Tax=Brevundimonas phage vB_BgoS-Bajun TaxID=2948594 RepID=A0A9E7N4Q7_9CAUD|nr:hypothetical protein BAJUN_02310 [Brevundimonas phage vB_BgoS-Bajun]
MIQDNEKLDFLWKRLLFGVSKTAKTADKAGSNEIIPAPITVYPESIWADAAAIPAFAAETPGVVLPYVGANRIAATTDPTSTPNLTWLATTTPGDINTRIGDFIPPTFGSSYAARVFMGDPNVGPAARLFPDTTGEEWVFDYVSGTLIFASSIPTSKTATIGSGNVTMAAGIFIEVYQYDGLLGFPPSFDDGSELLLGDTTGWDGQVVFAPDDSVTEAIDKINDALKAVAQNGGGGDGFAIPLGPIATDGDGSWTPGAVVLDDTTPVSEAVDRMNEVLGKLVPTAPTDFPGAALSVANGAGSSPRLATGVTANTANTLAAGDAVTRITAAGVTSNVFGDVGPGETGTVTALINGVPVGSRVLTGTADGGTYGGLLIADQKDFPVATPGFWKSIDISLSLAAASIGINKARITHSAAGQTNEVFFVRDALTATPAISAGTVVEAAAGTLAYSSSVPHYGDGASLTVALSMTNLAGETYYGGADPLILSGTNGIISADTLAYADLGITTPIARQTTTATAITPVTVAIDGANVHNTGVIQAVAKNVNGGSAATTVQAKNINVKRGSAGARLDEMAVTVSGLGSAPNANPAVRKGHGGTDTPAGAASPWNSSSAITVNDATVVGGVLKHDVTDYSGYLPAGPNLSAGRSGAQYVEFSFNRSALSAFKIAIAGTYAGVWVRLPGVSDNAGISPNAPNGWWNAFKPYDGAGVPGETGDNDAGCALGSVMNGVGGTFQITFGTQSSTNATGNEILVRIRLNAGQSITALSFTA